jgi:hypothetical protein
MNAQPMSVVGAALILASCGNDARIVQRLRLPGVSGWFVIEDSHRTTPMTAVEHSISYEANGEKKVIFRGSAGPSPRLTLLGPGTVLIAYCGGNILRLESSFFDDPRASVGSADASVKIVRLQAVTEKGLNVAGRAVC